MTFMFLCKRDISSLLMGVEDWKGKWEGILRR